MLESVRSMPTGVRLFLFYALCLLALIGLSMRWVIDQAIDAPVSVIGLVWMCLLAYTIFTTTLVIQRKQASRSLALGLTTLLLPAVPLAWLSLDGLAARWPITLALALLAMMLFVGLTRPEVRDYLNEP